MEEVSSNYFKLINRLVLNEHKTVTVTFLLRNTPLDVFQTQSLMKHFLESNPNVTANYYLLGPLKTELCKKYCAIVRGEHLADAKRRLAKVDICNIYSVQTKPTDLEDAFKTDWFDQNAPFCLKGFLKGSKAPSPSEFCSLTISPTSQTKGKTEKEEEQMNEEDDIGTEENAEVKKPTGAKPCRVSTEKAERKRTDFDKGNSNAEKGPLLEKECKNENNDENAVAHRLAKRPTAQPIKREAKVAKTKVTENGGRKQTTLLSFFRK